MSESTGSTAAGTTAPRSSSGFKRLGGVGRTVLFVSLLLNLLFVCLWLLSGPGDRLPERYHAGERSAKAKIAIVRVEGMIAEIFSGFVSQQLRDAATDDQVKAVVLAINSPGGTITASDLLHKQIKDLREGKWPEQKAAKPIVVAMESIAASGGYYIAVPCDRILAQPTTITGSIGIYAALPDLSRVPEKYGIDMTVLKRGELKGITLFRAMSPAEQQNLEDMLEHGYQRFMQVVAEGRGQRLKQGLRDELPSAEGGRPVLKDGQPYVRRLADGGIFTADEALRFGLIDGIGYLDDAIRHAKDFAGLTEARVITYVRPTSFIRSQLGIQADLGERLPEPGSTAGPLPGVSARFWYLTPGYELSGLSAPLNWLR